MAERSTTRKKWKPSHFRISHKFKADYIVYASGVCEIDSPFNEGGCGYLIIDTETGEIVREAYKWLSDTTNDRSVLLAATSAMLCIPKKKRVKIILSDAVASYRIKGKWDGGEAKDLLDMFSEAAKTKVFRQTWLHLKDDEILARVFYGSIRKMQDYVNTYGLRKGALFRKFICHEDVDIKKIYRERRQNRVATSHQLSLEMSI